jgi:WD40 repeat protein
VTGNCVRLMTGHKSPVTTIVFSYDGRFLASGGCDNRVLVPIWRISATPKKNSGLGTNLINIFAERLAFDSK